MLGKNIIFLRKQMNWTQADLAGKLEIARTTLGDYERGRTEPNLEMLMHLAELFGVTLDTLITQRMHIHHLQERNNSHLQRVVFEPEMTGMQHVNLVETKAEAGYLESFQDPEYIKELPKLYIPNLPKNEYRGFEIEGESMLPVEPGSIVIGTYVEALSDVKEQRTYVIITKREGMVYKRIQKFPSRKMLIAISDNPVFPPYEIAYEDIDEIWQYHAHLSFSDAPSNHDHRLSERIEDIQKKVDALYKKYSD